MTCEYRFMTLNDGVIKITIKEIEGTFTVFVGDTFEISGYTTMQDAFDIGIKYATIAYGKLIIL